MDDLGRLVAAERNALAAIQLAKTLSERLVSAEQIVAQTNEQNRLLQEQVTSLQQRFAMANFGSGPTQV